MSENQNIEYKEIANGFQISFFKSRDKGRDKGRDKSRDKTPDLLIQLITENNRVTQKEMAEKIGLSVKAIEKSIHKLKSAGLLERKGGKKSGYWQIIKKNK